MATGGVSTAVTATETVTLDNRGGPGVKQLLQPLNRDELKQLFEELGLSDETLKNEYDSNNKEYADDLIRAWMLKKDRVLDLGGPTKENMIKALRRIGQNGLATSFSTFGKFDQGKQEDPEKSTMVLDKLIPIMREVTNIPSHMHHEKEAKPRLVEHGMEKDSPEHNTSANSHELKKSGIESGLQATLTDTSHSPVNPHEVKKDSSTHNSHTDNSEEETNSSTSESFLLKQSDDKEEMVLKETTPLRFTLSQRMKTLTFDVLKTEKTCENLKQELQQKNDEIDQKNAKIKALKMEKAETDKKYQQKLQSLIKEKDDNQNELDTLRNRIAVLERETNIKKANLQDHTHPHSHELRKEVEDLKKELKQEKDKLKLKENEIIILEHKLKIIELELEKADDRYQIELLTVAKERDKIIVEQAELQKKIAEESQRESEEEMEKLKEELRRLKKLLNY